jgi:hypothetical protein
MTDQLKPIVVTSIPKSGTYLLGEVLSNLGYRPTWMHLAGSGTHFTQYSPARLAEGRDDPRRFRVMMPLEESLRLVRPGEFAVGHLPRTADTERLLGGFRVIFLKRELRACLVSLMRFRLETRRGEPFRRATWYRQPDRIRRTVLFLRDCGPEALRESRAIAAWGEHPDATTVSYEQVAGRQLESLLGASGTRLDACIGRALAARTLTRNEMPTDSSEHWSPAAESVFVEIGGLALSRALGYERPSESLKQPPVASR